jgi:hypothetical protein
LGISFCAFCEKGKYQALAFQTACSNCPAGQYTSFYLGSPYCTACPNGQVSEAGASSCDNERRRLGQYDATQYTVGQSAAVGSGEVSEALAVALKYQRGPRAIVPQLEEKLEEILAAYNEPVIVQILENKRRLENETAVLPEPPSCSCCYNANFKEFCTTYVGSIAGVCALNLMMAVVQVSDSSSM